MNEFNYEGWVGKVFGYYPGVEYFPPVGSDQTIYIVLEDDKATSYIYNKETGEYILFGGGGGGGDEGALHYRGTVASASDLPSTPANGDIYIATAAFELDGEEVDADDMLIWNENGAEWNIIQGNITIEDLQSDWNENNPDSSAFVKNRTHWEENNETIYFENFVNAIGVNNLVITDGTAIAIDPNKTYDLTINGVTYSNLVPSTATIEGASIIYVGESPMFDPEATDIPAFYGSIDYNGTILGYVNTFVPNTNAVSVKESGSSDSPYVVDMSASDYEIFPQGPEGTSSTTWAEGASRLWVFERIEKCDVGTFSLSVGDEYTISVNGTDYNCVASEWSSFGNYQDTPIILADGNEPKAQQTTTTNVFLGIYHEEDDTPYITYGINANLLPSELYGAANYSIVVKQGETIIHQLDDKYISDNIARVSDIPPAADVYMIRNFGTEVNNSDLTVEFKLFKNGVQVTSGTYYATLSAESKSGVGAGTSTTLTFNPQSYCHYLILSNYTNKLSDKFTLTIYLDSNFTQPICNQVFVYRLPADSIATNEQGYTTGDQVKTYVDNNGFNPSNMETVTDPVTLDTPQADWNQADSTAPDYIKNKPDITEWSVEYERLSTSQNRVYFRIYKNYRSLPDTEIGSLYCEIRKVDESDGTPTVVGSGTPIYAGYGSYYMSLYNSPTIDSSVFRFKIYILSDRSGGGFLLAHTDCINYNYIGNIETLLASI